MPENKSEVARLRQQIDLACESADRGMNGLAAVASHESIMKRMESAADPLLKLIDEGKFEEFLQRLSTPDWC